MRRRSPGRTRLRRHRRTARRQGRFPRRPPARPSAGSPGSNRRSDSTMSPTNSMRTGCSSEAGNTSRMPPRSANEPCSVTGSSRAKPAPEQQIRQVVRGDLGARPDLDRGSQHARRRAHARHQRGRRGHHQPRVPGRRQVQRAAPGGARPGSAGSCRGRGPPATTGTAAPAARFRRRWRRSSAVTKKRASPATWSTSLSVGTTSTVSRRSDSAAAAAASALTAGVSPAVTGRRLGQLQRADRAGDEGSKGERGSVQEHVLGRRARRA